MRGDISLPAIFANRAKRDAPIIYFSFSVFSIAGSAISMTAWIVLYAFLLVWTKRTPRARLL